MNGGTGAMANVRYEYDAVGQAIIRIAPEDTPRIIRERDHVWREFGPFDDSYRRAIYLGQGCWDRLETITKGQAEFIIGHWQAGKGNESGGIQP